MKHIKTLLLLLLISSGVFSRGSIGKVKFRNIDRRELLKAKMNQLRNGASIMSAESGIPFGNDRPVYRDLIDRDYK